MKLNENYQIISDDMNVILQKAFTKKDGVTKDWKSVKWYGNMTEALKGFAKMEIFSTELEDFEKIVAKIDELDKTIAKLGGNL